VRIFKQTDMVTENVEATIVEGRISQKKNFLYALNPLPAKKRRYFPDKYGKNSKGKELRTLLNLTRLDLEGRGLDSQPQKTKI